MGQLPKDCRALRQKQNPQLPAEQATCGALPSRNDLYLSTYAHVTWLWERMELMLESLHISCTCRLQLAGIKHLYDMKCFDSSSAHMNRTPMAWRKLAQRMNLNRWRRLHHRQFILHACIPNRGWCCGRLARWPRPKVGREGLAGRQGRQGCQGGGMTCWWVVWSWYPGKSLEHRQNYLRILYWSLLYIKEMKKLCIYINVKDYIWYLKDIYYTYLLDISLLEWILECFPPKAQCRALAVARHLLPSTAATLPDEAVDVAGTTAYV